jgi:hypothetical protein
VNQAYDLAEVADGWRRHRGVERARRSNKRMQQTRGGWRRVEASWSAVSRPTGIVSEGKVVRPSQLIRGVGRTEKVQGDALR